MNLHFVYSPFTSVGLHGGYRGDKWFKHRIQVFKDYTLKSLLNQSNRNFVHWLSFRPEERGHPYLIDLGAYLTQIGYRYIMTFDGLMYIDDKFVNYTLKTKLKNILMMLRDDFHNREFKNPLTTLGNAWDNKNKTLLKRLTSSLHTIEANYGNNYDWVYLTRIDSDDMFHRDALDLIQNQEPGYKKALVFDKGYILNIKTGQVADWNPPTNPPFHTIIFPSSVFFDPIAHLEYYGTFKSHEDIPKVFKADILDNQRYMVAYHGKHISTDWNSPPLKKVHHKLKYGSTNPFKGYMYTTGTGVNISTHWNSRTTQVKNSMIGKEYSESAEILKEFGV